MHSRSHQSQNSPCYPSRLSCIGSLQHRLIILRPILLLALKTLDNWMDSCIQVGTRRQESSTPSSIDNFVSQYGCSKFFHCRLWKICDKTVIKYPTTPKTRRYSCSKLLLIDVVLFGRMLFILTTLKNLASVAAKNKMLEQKRFFRARMMCSQSLLVTDGTFRLILMSEHNI